MLCVHRCCAVTWLWFNLGQAPSCLWDEVRRTVQPCETEVALPAVCSRSRSRNRAAPSRPSQQLPSACPNHSTVFKSRKKFAQLFRTKRKMLYDVLFCPFAGLRLFPFVHATIPCAVMRIGLWLLGGKKHLRSMKYICTFWRREISFVLVKWDRLPATFILSSWVFWIVIWSISFLVFIIYIPL